MADVVERGRKWRGPYLPDSGAMLTARGKSALISWRKSEPQSLRASERFCLQLKDRDTKRDNRATVYETLAEVRTRWETYCRRSSIRRIL